MDVGGIVVGETADEEVFAVLLADVDRDPARARGHGRRLVADAEGPRLRSLGWQLQGLAALADGRPAEARTAHDAAVAAAREAGDPARLAACLVSLAPSLLYLGDPAAALAALDAAVAASDGPAAARAQVQRAAVLDIVGRQDEAAATYAAALPVLAAAGDRTWLGRAHTNRANLHVQRGDVDAARADLREARRLAVADGHALAAAQATHNLGWVATIDGDVVTALEDFDLAAEAVRTLADDGAVAAGAVDRAAALLAAGLVEEATRVGAAAVRGLVAAGMATEADRARLVVGQAALLAGDLDRAATAAAEVAASASAQGRDVHAALGHVLAGEVAWRRRDGALDDVRADVAAAATALARVGWPDAHATARAVAVRLALLAGDLPAARREAQHLGDARSVRAEVLQRDALARLLAAEGDRGAALVQVRGAMEVLDAQRAAVGAADLRSAAATLGADVAEFGRSLAVAGGDARATWWWAEATRAAALAAPPVRPPGDAELRAALARLRDTVATIDAAVLAGDDITALVARQAELEREVAARGRRARGVAGPGPAADPADRADGTRDPDRIGLDEVRRALAGRRLLELLVVDDVVRAVDVTAGEVVQRVVGPLADVAGMIDGLDFALRRMAMGMGSATTLAAARDSARELAGRLDRALLGDAPVPAAGVVVVPTAELHAVSWAVMPRLRGVPVSVAPSARLWHRAWRRRRDIDLRRARVGAASGPDLEHAEAEVEAVVAVHPRATGMRTREATAARVLTMLDDVDVAHLACHGAWRGDNPLFSSLRLADGPLTVHDLGALSTPPHTIVLSACESGRATVRPGDELLGLAAALLGVGVATVVAATVPVSDAATLAMMRDLHARLASGVGPAAALAATSAALLDDDDVRLAAAAGAFAVLGAG